MKFIGNARIGKWGMVLAVLVASAGLRAEENAGLVNPPTLPKPSTASVAEGAAAPVKPEPSADSISLPTVIKDVGYAGGFSSDGRWLLYANPLKEEKTENEILAHNVTTQETKKLGTLAWQGAEPPNRKRVNPMFPAQAWAEPIDAMIPRLASADMSHLFVSAGHDRLWHWVPATGSCEGMAGPTRDTAVGFEPVPGASADGKYLAVVENRSRLRVIGAADGQTVKVVENLGKNTYLDEVRWLGNQVVLLSGDEIQLWPERTAARWKSLLKKDENRVQWVGATDTSVLVRTTGRVCRWNPGEPEKLVEVVSLPADHQVLFDSAGARIVTMQLVEPAADGKDSDLCLRIAVLDCDGKPMYDTRKEVPLAEAFAPAIKEADASSRQETKKHTPQLRIKPLVVRGERLLTRLQRENRYGFYGYVVEIVAVVEFGEKPCVRTNPKDLLQWSSSGVTDAAYPEITVAEASGACAVRQGNTIRLYRLP